MLESLEAYECHLRVTRILTGRSGTRIRRWLQKHGPAVVAGAPDAVMFADAAAPTPQIHRFSRREEGSRLCVEPTELLLLHEKGPTTNRQRI